MDIYIFCFLLNFFPRQVGVKEWALAGKGGWLNMDLPVGDQWNKSDGALQFRKKYFLTDNELPATGRERLLLFYQIRQLIASGVYICSAAQHVRFAALAAQAAFGDRDAEKHGASTLTSVQQLMPQSVATTQADQVLEAWSSLRGRPRDEAAAEYTRIAISEIPTYGVVRFPVTEAGIKDRKPRDLGITQSHIFRIVDNQIVEQIRLEELRTWNFTPKTIELEFPPQVREKYVAFTTKGREILALLSEYQYFNRSRAGMSDSIKVHFNIRVKVRKR